MTPEEKKVNREIKPEDMQIAENEKFSVKKGINRGLAPLLMKYSSI